MDTASDFTRDRMQKILHVSTLLEEQVQLATAEKMYTGRWLGYERALGPDHTSALHTINNLRLLYTSQGKLD